MKTLEDFLSEYLDLRRHLGFKLRDASGQLRHFVLFAQKQKARFITTKLAVRWATQLAGCQSARSGTRLGMVRQFARFVSGTDPRTEVPPEGLLPSRYPRRAPYLYTDKQILQLLEAAKAMPARKGLRAVTYSTLFGLLAVTGMRLGETLSLDCKDVHLEECLLKIRQTKFNKSRWVPIHSSVSKRLREYQHLRNKVCPSPKSDGFFLSERGTRLAACCVREWFDILSRQIGLRSPTVSHGPRIHDLRHSFVVRTLRHWYETKQDVEARLPELTTYIGHGHVEDTYWYISATPELLRLATERLEAKERLQR